MAVKLLNVAWCSVITLTLLQVATALQCLSDQCSNSVSGEPACATSTAGARNVTCPPGQQCYTMRRYLLYPGYVDFFQRRCNDDIGRGACTYMHNNVYYTCEESCDSDLCNSGNGVPSGYDPLPPTTTTTTTTSTTTTTTTSSPVPTTGRHCYICSYVQSSDASATYGCVVGVATSRSIKCSADRICVVKRVISLRSNKVTSFERSCLPSSYVKPGCVKDFYSSTCQTTCSGHLCNTGNGIPTNPTNGGSGWSAGSCILKIVMFLLYILLLGDSCHNRLF